MTQLERLIAEVDALSPEDKERLFDHLAQQLEDEANPILSDEWQAEIARRVQDVRNGNVSPLTWEEIRESLMRRLRDHPA